jgi:hypothetical protein
MVLAVMALVLIMHPATAAAASSPVLALGFDEGA